MRALSNLVTTRLGMVALALLVAFASTLACAWRACHRDDYRGVGCRAAAAQEDLGFGLSREAAIDAIGRSEVEPPWKNDLGLGPSVISNPFDSETMKSPIGEEYEVVRFYVEAIGNPDCPFIQGELRLEPLIFVDDRLVGWRWSYLADVLGERISMKAKRWDFGSFCDGRRASPSNAEPSDAVPPDAGPSTAGPSDAEASESTSPSTPETETSGSRVDR
jgi:hypothetical protein